MKDTLKLIWSLVVLVALLIILFYISSFNYKNFSLEGIRSCEKDCLSEISIKNVYTGTQIEVSPDYTYGGAVSPQICLDDNIAYGIICEELDISVLHDYAIVTPIIAGQVSPMGNYYYLNKFVQSNHKHKAYFLYSMYKEGAKWVYEEPLKIISYDVKTKSILDEGKIDVNDVYVRDVHISPLGNYILLVDGWNPRYLPPTTTTGITIFNLKDKKTKRLIEIGDGTNIGFVSWIDDTHFFYTTSSYESTGKITFKIGTIE